MEELLSLEVARFDGSHLDDIVVAIGRERNKGATDEECFMYATEVIKTNKDLVSAPDTTCSAIVKWVAFKFAHKNPVKMIGRRVLNEYGRYFFQLFFTTN